MKRKFSVLYPIGIRNHGLSFLIRPLYNTFRTVNQQRSYYLSKILLQSILSNVWKRKPLISHLPEKGNERKELLLINGDMQSGHHQKRQKLWHTLCESLIIWTQINKEIMMERRQILFSCSKNPVSQHALEAVTQTSIVLN